VPIHVTKDGEPQLFDGPKAVNFFRMNVLLHGMRTELKTGMKLSRGPSCFFRVKQEYGLKGNKQKLIEQFEKLVAEENQKMEYVKSPKDTL
jgi:hypothetical protein